MRRKEPLEFQNVDITICDSRWNVTFVIKNKEAVK